jgi:cytochrome P450 family 619
MFALFKYSHLCAHNYRLPLGVPHRVNQDDYYNGMLIPKDSTVLIPIWAMHFAEKFGYKNAEKYDPDRFTDFPRLASEYAGAADFMNRDKWLSLDCKVVQCN